MARSRYTKFETIKSGKYFLPQVWFCSKDGDVFFTFKVEKESDFEAKKYANRAYEAFIVKNTFLHTPEDWNNACSFFEKYNE